MKRGPFSQQKIAVLGAGESGIEAARLLVGRKAHVHVLDTASEHVLQKAAQTLSKESILLAAGADALACARDAKRYDLAVISPGIDPATPLAQGFFQAGVPVISELELAYLHCPVPVVAITGTNGKTTTTQLIEAVFNGCGVPTVACGNIGPAFSSKVVSSRNLSAMTVEVSSFQLERIESFKPKVSVWLNFTPDHLDRYDSMRQYFDAKARIFENQSETDWAVVNGGDELPQIRARKITFSASRSDTDFILRNGEICFRGETVLRMEDTALRGIHNGENLMAALGVGFTWGLSWEQMRRPLCEYRPLPHRCERVSMANGVEFINDSKATNVDALQKALLSQDKPVVLIAGGKDKGFEFDAVTSLVAEKCRCVLLIGEMSDRIYALWNQTVPCRQCGSLREAVANSRAAAHAGDVVLFSPGTSSFDMFKNYADRGDQFRDLVLEMIAEERSA